MGGGDGVVPSTGSGSRSSIDVRGSPAAPASGLDAAFLQRLLNGSERLPHSERFLLPAAVPCRGGCDDESYCTAACEAAAWEAHHQLLCTGPAESADADVRLENGSADVGADEPRRKRTRHAVAAVPDQTAHHGACSAVRQKAAIRHDGGQQNDGASADVATRRDALVQFKAHADATNDIFHVAARLIAGVLLRAAAQLNARAASSLRQGSSAAHHLAEARSPDAAELSSVGKSAGTDEHSEPVATACGAGDLDAGACWTALQRAWEPHAVAWKAVWWEAVALPSDITNEAAFRQGKQSATLRAVTGVVAGGCCRRCHERLPWFLTRT